MMNQSIIVGRLIENIEIKDNKSIIKIAVTRSFKNEEGIYETDFVPVVLMNVIASNTAEYCQKGDLVGIKGRLQTFDDKLYLMAEKVTFLSSKKVNKNEENNEENEE